jgi:outer membrane immunogenic protein
MFASLIRGAAVVAVAAIVLAPAFAVAADPVSARRFAPEPPRLKQKDWSGAYFGVHGGYVGNGRRSASAAPNIPALNFNAPAVGNKGSTRNVTGAGFGAQAGYNFQSGNIVYGVEAQGTFNTAGNKRSATNLTAREQYRAALKGKLGYSFGSTMVYGTAGVAIAPLQVSAPATATTAAARRNVNGAGAVVGLGVEHRLTDNISVRGELEYTAFGKQRLTLPAGTTSVERGQIAATAGLNYRF